MFRRIIYPAIILFILLQFLACKTNPAPAAAADDQLDIAIRGASDYLNTNVPQGSKIVILNISSPSLDLSDYIIDELIANAVNDKNFSVVERQQLDLIRAEQNFQMSGDVDDSEALAIGRFLGAQTIVSGSVRNLGSGHRITIRALDVRTARVQGQYNRNIDASARVADILAVNNPPAAVNAKTSVSSAPAALVPGGVTSTATMRRPVTIKPASKVPDAVELQFGSMISGEMEAGVEYWYSARTAKSGFLAIETFGSVIDPVLHIFNAAMEEIATNDDGGERFNARAELLTEANQLYYIKLRASDGKSSAYPNGPYRIMSSFLDDRTGQDLPNTSRPQAALLKTNQAITVSFTGKMCRWFYYEVTKYGTFTIFTEGSLDTQLYLWDRYGNLIVKDDDSGGERNAKISRNLNPGIYFIDLCEHRSRTGSTSLHADFK